MAKAHRHGRVQRHRCQRWLNVNAPIGIFDSGMGGLSALPALRAALPHEHLLYWADSAHAPYGEKGDDFVRRRSLAITEHLVKVHGIKALVVACNTATAATIAALRSTYPQLPIVGLEPALKPAAQLTRTGRVGVMATQGTVSSEKFQRLLHSLEGQADFVVQPCPGLALAIENSAHPDTQAQAHQVVHGLLQRFTQAMGRFGTQPGEIDTLVLGCTHYVFVQDDLQRIVGADVRCLSTGEPVAQQTQRLLEAAGALRTRADGAAQTQLLTNGDLAGLQGAAQRWLGLSADHCALADPAI
jgi:glutamate racemase